MLIANTDDLRNKLIKHDQLMSASIEITRRCNESCIHCLRNLANDDGLPYSTVCDVLDQLCALGCIKLTFTGGEPFTRHDFMDVVAYAWSKRLAIRILTNGTLITPSIAADLKSLHVYELQFSLYAADPTVHDSVTSVPGSFQRTLRGVHMAHEQGIRIRIAMPVLKVNAGQYRDLEAMCNELGAEFSAPSLIFPKDDGSLAPLSLLAQDDQVRSVIMQGISSASINAHSRKAAPENQLLCSAGRERIGIKADGLVYPCDALHQPIGDVYTDRLADIWHNSPFLASLRTTYRQYPPECDGCGDRDACIWCAGLSMQLMGSPGVPNSQDCRRTRSGHGQLVADAPGWSVPVWAEQVRPCIVS